MDLNALGVTSEISNHYMLLAISLFNWNNRNQQRKSLRSIPSGWRNNFYQYQQDCYILNEEETSVKYRFQKEKFHFKLGEQAYSVKLITCNNGNINLEIDGIRYAFTIANNGNHFFIHNEQFGNKNIQLKDRFPAKEVEKVQGGYESPMPSQIIKVLVKEGQEVSSGDGLIILSSMKMENTIEASEDGIVEEIYTEEGQSVEAGFLLLKLKEKEA